MERRMPLPRSLFKWVAVAALVAMLLGFVFGTRMLFVAGAIILLGFSFGVVQSAITLHRDRSRRNILMSAVDLLPHGVVLLLAIVLLCLVVREFLRR